MAQRCPYFTPEEFTLYWGDLHKHLTGPGADIDRLEDMVSYASEHLDFCAVLCYPFKWYRKGREGGIREETVGNYPEFEEWWDRVQEVSRSHLDPGEFVTFPAYEWNGNRRQWGDHNVVYREEGAPLDDEWAFPDLCKNMADREALVVPHHTGYLVGERGKDWDAFDPALSPVMEVYSSHGSSEGTGTLMRMTDNHDMGPRTSGGTFQNALDRGLRVGAVASNDGPGLPGTWGRGVAGVWASDLTREGIWSAIQNRHTLGVTGDRITLWLELNEAPMGTELDSPAEQATGGSHNARVAVDCPRPLDRVQLVHNGRVAGTYPHHDQDDSSETDIYRTVVEFGWGPNAEYGDFDDVACRWRGSIRVVDGDLRRVQPRFAGFGQEYRRTGDGCRFDLVTVRGEEEESVLPESQATSYRQGFVVEYESGPDTELVISLDSHDDISVPHGEAVERTHLVPFVDESWTRLEREFDLVSDDIHNEDIVYHNARKVRIHRAAPRTACRTGVEFDDIPVKDDWNYYYVRVSQTNGQYAWASPVWVDHRTE